LQLILTYNQLDDFVHPNLNVLTNVQLLVLEIPLQKEKIFRKKFKRKHLKMQKVRLTSSNRHLLVEDVWKHD